MMLGNIPFFYVHMYFGCLCLSLSMTFVGQSSLWDYGNAQPNSLEDFGKVQPQEQPDEGPVTSESRYGPSARKLAEGQEIHCFSFQVHADLGLLR